MLKNFLRLVSMMLFTAACSSAPSGDVVEINMEMREFSYTPSTIEVRAGQLLRINLLNKGNIEHDFSITDIPTASKPKVANTKHAHEMTGLEPYVHASAEAGAKNIVEFTPTKPGIYEFYCVIKGHKEEGMVGKLIVK
jgi:uncharacterized cupredoxin-like copper-binding protein